MSNEVKTIEAWEPLRGDDYLGLMFRSARRADDFKPFYRMLFNSEESARKAGAVLLRFNDSDAPEYEHLWHVVPNPKLCVGSFVMDHKPDEPTWSQTPPKEEGNYWVKFGKDAECAELLYVPSVGTWPEIVGIDANYITEVNAGPLMGMALSAKDIDDLLDVWVWTQPVGRPPGVALLTTCDDILEYTKLRMGKLIENYIKRKHENK